MRYVIYTTSLACHWYCSPISPCVVMLQDNHRQLTVALWSANFGTTSSGSCNLQRTVSLLNATGMVHCLVCVVCTYVYTYIPNWLLMILSEPVLTIQCSLGKFCFHYVSFDTIYCVSSFIAHYLYWRIIHTV